MLKFLKALFTVIVIWSIFYLLIMTLGTIVVTVINVLHIKFLFTKLLLCTGGLSVYTLAIDPVSNYIIKRLK